VRKVLKTRLLEAEGLSEWASRIAGPMGVSDADIAEHLRASASWDYWNAKYHGGLSSEEMKKYKGTLIQISDEDNLVHGACKYMLLCALVDEIVTKKNKLNGVSIGLMSFDPKTKNAFARLPSCRATHISVWASRLRGS